jgi:NADH-quinone oxidoreductase subunit D
MEELIQHFKFFSEGLHVPTGITYSAVESAKGEFGVLLIANKSNKPFRCYIRSPAFFHTQLFAPMTQGHFFADLITIIGAQDIVMGEVDK